MFVGWPLRCRQRELAGHALLAGTQNLFQNTVDLTEHTIIVESQHLVSEGFQNLGAMNIVLLLPIVNRAIQLHDDATCGTAKVRHVAPQWVLATKFEAAELPPA